jgi:hypothetical protein
MNNTLSHAGRTLFLIVILICSRTACAADRGWYVGAGLGEVDYGNGGILFVESERLDANVIDDSDDLLSSSISLAVGYRFNRFLSLELGYLSNDSTTFALTDSGGQRFGTYEFRSEGPSLAVVGILPLGKWEFSARAGVLYADTEVRLVTELGTVWSDNVRSPEAVAAVGAAYNFTEHWQARLDYAYVLDAGERNETGHLDIEVLTLGLTYRF